MYYQVEIIVLSLLVIEYHTIYMPSSEGNYEGIIFLFLVCPNDSSFIVREEREWK